MPENTLEIGRKSQVENLQDYVDRAQNTAQRLRELKAANDEHIQPIVVYLHDAIYRKIAKEVPGIHKDASGIEIDNTALFSQIPEIIEGHVKDVQTELKAAGISHSDIAEIHVGILGENIAGVYLPSKDDIVVSSGVLALTDGKNQLLRNVLNHEQSHQTHETATANDGYAFIDPEHKIIEGLNSLYDHEINGTPVPESYKPYVQAVYRKMRTAGMSLAKLCQLYEQGRIGEIGFWMGYELERKTA